MSGRPPRPPPPEPVEDDDDEEEMDEEMDEYDGVDILSSLLATEEGESVADILCGIRESMDKIALNLEMQNKVLVKIVAALNKVVPAGVAATA